MPRPRGLRRRLALALGAGVGALVLAEFAARLLVPGTRFLSPELVDENVAWARTQRTLVADDELGFVPAPESDSYDAFGLLRSFGPRPPQGGPCTLCLGDSVTRRGTVLEPLRTFLGGAAGSLVNAGVESWNPVQEVGFYLQKQKALAADHVVLSLHNNDLTATSLGLWVGDAFVMCSPGSRTTIHPTLYRWSMLYRLYVHSSFVHGAHPRNYTRDAEAVEQALAQLRDEVVGRGAKLTVLVLPILAAEAQWQEHERRARDLELAMLHRLGIAAVDLQPACAALCAAGIHVRADADDPWHPDAQTGAVLAAAAAPALARGAPVVRAGGFAVADGAVQELRVQAGAANAGRKCLVVAVSAPPGGTWQVADEPVPVAAGMLDAQGEAVLQVAPQPGTAAVQWHAVVLPATASAPRTVLVPPVPMVVTH